MPDISSSKSTVTTYPPTSLYEQWQERADEMDMSTSQYIIRMVEAGRKQANLQETTSNSMREIRSKHADLKRELERQRTRNQELENQLHQTAHDEIIDFVESNPGATTAEIIQRVADTVPGRVAGHLDLLEGDFLEVQDGQFYSQDSDGGSDQATSDTEETSES